MISLKHTGPLIVLLSFALGVLATALWLGSAHRWTAHLSEAARSGQALYDHLLRPDASPPPVHLRLSPLDADDRALADAGQFERLSMLPHPARVTVLSLGPSLGPQHPEQSIEARLQIAAISSALHYPLSKLALPDALSASSPPGKEAARNTLGAMVAMMARYCSDAVLVLRLEGGDWQRIEAPSLWPCSASPPDRRLPALLIALISLATLILYTLNISAKFTDFAAALTRRQATDRIKKIPMTGPKELREIIAAVNAYRDAEQKHLSERAVIMSAVSHDLGTPATRLKLRATTIEDSALRAKLEADIDQMTGIIESVLTYTRSELSTEEPRQLSLSSLIEAIVDDYQDIGAPVRLAPIQSLVIEEGRSIFMSRQRRNALSAETPVLVLGRPLALRRAIGNLIDNALKYGRSATLHLEADADEARISVEDEGRALTSDELEALRQPFTRGSNAKTAQGFGMGLTIVSSIALEHGGALSFRPGKNGTIAELRIPRG